LAYTAAGVQDALACHPLMLRAFPFPGGHDRATRMPYPTLVPPCATPSLCCLQPLHHSANFNCMFQLVFLPCCCGATRLQCSSCSHLATVANMQLYEVCRHVGIYRACLFSVGHLSKKQPDMCPGGPLRTNESSMMISCFDTCTRCQDK